MMSVEVEEESERIILTVDGHKYELLEDTVHGKEGEFFVRHINGNGRLGIALSVRPEASNSIRIRPESV